MFWKLGVCLRSALREHMFHAFKTSNPMDNLQRHCHHQQTAKGSNHANPRKKTAHPHQLLCPVRTYKHRSKREKAGRETRQARLNAIKKPYLQKIQEWENGQHNASTKTYAPRSADAPAQHTDDTNKSSQTSTKASFHRATDHCVQLPSLMKRDSELFNRCR